MMEKVLITKNGILAEEFNENLGLVENVTISNKLSYYYKSPVELASDLTFGDLFTQLEPYLDILEDHFMAETRGWPLKPFFDLIKGDVVEDSGFTEIQFSWRFDYFEYLDRRSGKLDKSLDEYVNLGAIGESDEYGINNYSLSFVELNDIKNVPVKILNECQIYGKDRKTPILEFERGLSLGELIGSLLHEITFYGSPEKMREQKSILDERCSKVYDESELIPWEDIELEWLEEELNEALEIEDYEWAERVRKKIEEVKGKN